MEFEFDVNSSGSNKHTWNSYYVQFNVHNNVFYNNYEFCKNNVVRIRIPGVLFDPDELTFN